MRPQTRREWLRRLALVLAAAPLAGCGRRDPFAERCVCIHIVEAGERLPQPLLDPPRRRGELTPARRDFDIGLPELMVCDTWVRLLDVHRYFGPVTRAMRDDLGRPASLRFVLPTLRSAGDLQALEAFLRRPFPAVEGVRTALILTLHGETRAWLPRVVRAWRDAALDQLVILKDPTTPPWLCEFPARQLNRPW